MERNTLSDSGGRIIPLDDAIELRPVRMDNAVALNAAITRNRDRLRQWLPWIAPTYSLDDTRRFLAEKERENAARSELTMAISVDGGICGVISLHRIDRAHRNTSIGYWIDAGLEGKGVMTRACRAIVTEGFAQYGLHRIEIRCATGNFRSAAIPMRLGFVEEGILRDAEWLYDHWVDLRVFGMLEQHWKR